MTEGLIVLGLLVLAPIALWYSGKWLLEDAQRFLAPDNADRDAINAEFGEGTPEARAALDKRFGPDSHWRDAATGLSGLAGVLVLLWILFG